MSKPYTDLALSDLFDEEMIWRRRELSDMKAAVKSADLAAKSVLLRAITTMIYAHWEGYVRSCAKRYFEYLTIRRKRYAELERQIYVNTFLVRFDAFYQSRANIETRCRLVNEILDGINGTFHYVPPALVDTKSNLSTDVVKEICLICSIDPSHFEEKRTLIDQLLLRRRNAIAHGQQEFIHEDDIHHLVGETLALMQHFSTLLENKIYLRKYAA